MSDTPKKPEDNTRVRGVWVAYHQDMSSVTPHSSEVAALRDAVGGSKQVVFVPFGTAVEEATR